MLMAEGVKVMAELQSQKVKFEKIQQYPDGKGATYTKYVLGGLPSVEDDEMTLDMVCKVIDEYANKAAEECIEPRISVENDGVGAYEFWGFRGFDAGEDYVIVGGNENDDILIMEVEVTHLKPSVLIGLLERWTKRVVSSWEAVLDDESPSPIYYSYKLWATATLSMAPKTKNQNRSVWLTINLYWADDDNG